MSDSAQFWCVTDGWTNPNGDSGGVHTNSGIPNHAYALTVDGGSYNGRTVTGIGLLKAAKIWYRALTTYLTSGSTFLDSYNALIQSCTDLTGTNGITARQLHAGHDRAAGRRDEPALGLRRRGPGAGSLSFGNTDDRVFRWRRSFKRQLGLQIRNPVLVAVGGELRVWRSRARCRTAAPPQAWRPYTASP